MEVTGYFEKTNAEFQTRSLEMIALLKTPPKRVVFYETDESGVWGAYVLQFESGSCRVEENAGVFACTLKNDRIIGLDRQKLLTLLNIIFSGGVGVR